MDSTEDTIYINVDIVNLPGVNLVWDLNKTLPFDNEQFDEIIMNDIIEHLDSPIKMIRECHRLLKLNGTLWIKVVYFSHKYAWGDPQHKHAFSETYFEHFLKRHPRNYCYEFGFSTLNVTFIYQDIGIIQGMDITLIK